MCKIETCETFIYDTRVCNNAMQVVTKLSRHWTQVLMAGVIQVMKLMSLRKSLNHELLLFTQVYK